ncbi:MAG: ABC transporter ATP-binding protein [Pseudomonadota bacterium]
MNGSEYVIDVSEINKYFGDKHVVNNLSLKIKRGEIVGFLGPNGSGKTTSIRMMCGLLTPDSGVGRCLGFDILTEREQIKRRVGYMTQRFSYWDDLSIHENLDFIARIYGMKNRREAVERSLETLGLTSRAKQLAGSLSGGWKQRLALAACMLHEPELLLLDEPTAGVDPKARREFWEELHHLASRGISVLVSTHYMDEAERCHKLAYISYGKLLAQGTAAEIIENQKLFTWSLSFGKLTPDLALVSEALKGTPGVDQVIMFGTSLHVTGKDEAALERTLRQLTEGSAMRLEPLQTSLEDVFIHLMNTSSADNFV